MRWEGGVRWGRGRGEVGRRSGVRWGRGGVRWEGGVVGGGVR